MRSKIVPSFDDYDKARRYGLSEPRDRWAGSEEGEIQTGNLSTFTSNIFPGVKVARAENYIVNGCEVTVNAYNGDGDHLQVFIDRGSRTITDTVRMCDLNKYIRTNTR